MSKTISEQTLETAIIADLVKGHYIQRPPSAFDKALCLDPGPLTEKIGIRWPIRSRFPLYGVGVGRFRPSW